MNRSYRRLVQMTGWTPWRQKWRTTSRSWTACRFWSICWANNQHKWVDPCHPVSFADLFAHSDQVPPQPTRNERRKLSVTALSVDTSRSEQRPSVRDSMTPVGEHIRMLDTPLDSSAMPTGLVVSTPSSGALTPAPPNMDSLSSKRSKEVFRSPIEEEVLSSKAATPLLRPSLVNASRHARSTPDFRRNESESPAAYTKTERVRHTEGQDSTGTGRPAISRSESTTSGKRSGTQDTCFKVLPAAVKVSYCAIDVCIGSITYPVSVQKYSLKHVRRAIHDLTAMLTLNCSALDRMCDWS